jgi:Bacterial membrane protein YfhO
VLALVVSFYPAFFGQLPVPATGALTLIPGGPAPTETNELSDVPTQFLPWSRAVADAYRDGRMPFRFAANGCGTALWANPQAQAVTPTTLLDVLMPESWASAAAGAVKLFLAAWGTFVLFRAHGVSAAGSTLGGLAFGFSLFFTTWLHFPHSYAHAFLPWTLWAFRRVARGEAGAFRAALAVTALLLLAGYPEGEVYVALTAAVFFLVVLAGRSIPAREAAKRAGLAVGAAALALGLTAVSVLPEAFQLSGSERSRMASLTPRAEGRTLALRDFAKPPVYWDVMRFWLVPEVQGNPRDGDKFGPYSFAGRASGYAGILVLALAVATFLSGAGGRDVRWCRFAAVATALYVLWYPPLRFFLEQTPGVREVVLRLTTNRANGILVLVVAFLAARQLDRLRDGGGRGAAITAVAVLFAGLILVAAEFLRAPGRPELTIGWGVRLVLPGILLAGLVAMLMKPRPAAALVAFVLAGTAVDVLRIGVRFNPGTPPEHYYPMTPEVRALQAASRGGRFASAQATLTGMAYMYGLEDVRAHDPSAAASFAETLGATTGYTWESYAATVPRTDAPFLAFTNVRAIVEGAETRRHAAREAAFPQRLVGKPDGPAVLAAMAQEDDFLGTAYAQGRGDETYSGDAEVLEWKRVRPEKLLFRVRATSARLLVIPETNDGGWRAESDGAELSTLVVNHAFLGVRVPAGERTIICRYVPPGFREGAAVSAASLIILAMVGVRSRGRRTDPAPRGAPSGRTPGR